MSDKIEQLPTPLSTIMDMVKNEIETLAVSSMGANNLPPSLMTYVVKDVLLDIMQMKIEQMSEDFVKLQKKYQNLFDEYEKILNMTNTEPEDEHGD